MPFIVLLLAIVFWPATLIIFGGAAVAVLLIVDAVIKYWWIGAIGAIVASVIVALPPSWNEDNHYFTDLFKKGK